MNAQPEPGTEEICFVACVEAGRLEGEVVRLAESLRRWGGSLAESEILAVVPRRGPPLARATRKRMDELRVRCLRVPGHPRYSWYHYMNKPVALAAAERASDAPLVAFLDSDVLVSGEPGELRIPGDVEFAACVPDTGIVGTTGPDSPTDRHWAQLCEALDMDVDELPWVRTAGTRTAIRLYFNSGVFVYRRDSGLLPSYTSLCTSALDAEVGFPGRGEHYFDQICLGLAVMKLGLRWRCLSFSHNYTLLQGKPDSESELCPGSFREASILHYHDSLRPEHWEVALATIAAKHPQMSRWLAARGPIGDVTPVRWRLIREILRAGRSLPRRRYRRRARSPT